MPLQAKPSIIELSEERKMASDLKQTTTGNKLLKMPHLLVIPSHISVIERYLNALVCSPRLLHTKEYYLALNPSIKTYSPFLDSKEFVIRANKYRSIDLNFI